MTETWYPRAKRRPGPVRKIQAMTNPGKGVICHSMVGYRHGAYSVLDNVVGKRGTVMWHFSVYQDGSVEQHAPLEAVLHHAGDWGRDQDGANGNGELIGIEHEGGFDPANEPLTKAQRDASVELVRWIGAQRGWEPSRTGRKTLWEHNELSDEGTQCPSGRIPWGYYTVKEAPKPKEKPVALTTEQQQMVDYLRSPAGRALEPAAVAYHLKTVGLTEMPGETVETPSAPSTSGLSAQKQAQALRLVQEAQTFGKQMQGRLEAAEKLLGA